MQLQKSGIRVLGISESFSSREISCLCGVVMRRDLHVDGFCFGQVTVGGTDATEVISSMITTLNRKDINLVMLNGCVIAWYNIIDPEYLNRKFSIPVIGVSYERSDGLEDHISRHFPGDEERLFQYRKLGSRTEIHISGTLILYGRGWGISEDQMVRACKIFTHQGKIPEPLRVARLCARSLMQQLHPARSG